MAVPFMKMGLPLAISFGRLILDGQTLVCTGDPKGTLVPSHIGLSEFYLKTYSWPKLHSQISRNIIMAASPSQEVDYCIFKNQQLPGGFQR